MTPRVLSGKMLRRYSVRLRIYSWPMIYLPLHWRLQTPSLIPSGDVGRRQQRVLERLWRMGAWCCNRWLLVLQQLIEFFLGVAMSDEDMTPMHMTIIGAWHGKGVQQRCPSHEGGPRLIQFESPRWRPKITQVQVHLGVQEKHTPKMMSPFWAFYIWMEI